MKIADQSFAVWEKILKEIPVAVNNFYGDPVLQWNDTLEKLENLLATAHTGPVGLITKGRLTESHCRRLQKFSQKGLKIIVLVSISELDRFEKIGQEHRYENLRILTALGIKCLAYFRPLTPPYNTSPEIIEKVCAKVAETGCPVMVASGFRGDDAIIQDMKPDEKTSWVMRVKLMTGAVYQALKKSCQKHNIQLFTRTACAISFLTGQKQSYNPYYHSPNLVHCEDLKCPLRQTCGRSFAPSAESLALAKFLGYELEIITEKCPETCSIKPEKRLECPSCCTTCFRLRVSRILVKNSGLRLGDLTFIRFLTGCLAVQPGKKDDGSLKVGYVTLPRFPKISGIQCLNSWWPYAHLGDRCFGCLYCVERYYGNARRNFGFPPAKLLELINPRYA